MFKLLFILAIGVAIGYGYGWKDAQQHDKNVAERLVDHIGGETRERMGNDADKRYGTGDTVTVSPFARRSRSPRFSSFPHGADAVSASAVARIHADRSRGRLLPYRDVRREMADSGPDAFETTLLRRVGRTWVCTDDRVSSRRQPAGRPRVSVADAGPRARMGHDIVAPRAMCLGAASGATSAGRPTPALELFPAPSDQSAGRAGDTKRDAGGGLANVRRVTPARGSRAAHAHCRYCDSQLPGDRKITYCPHCGMDLTKRQCQACSTELEAHWRYCVTCGRGS